MARVYKRTWTNAAGEIKWAWILDYKDFVGKRIRERSNATTEKAAERLMYAKMNDIDRAKVLGLSAVPELTPMTFEKFVDGEYLPYAKTSKRPGSYRRDLSLWANVKAAFGSKSLSAITAADVERFVISRRNSKKAAAPATINREKSFISAALSVAVRRGYITVNPARAVPRLREDNAKDRWLSYGEETAIREQIRTEEQWVEPIITIAVNTGLRESEIANLKWADVRDGMIRVSVESSKNHKVRHVPVNSAVAEVLKSTTRHMVRVTDADGTEKMQPSPFVFVNPVKGKPYQGNSIYHAFKRACVAAGYPDVAFHTLRHTFASRAIQAGIPEREVQRFLGHGSPHMTARYAHLAPVESSRDVLEVLASEPKAALTVAGRGGKVRTRRVGTRMAQIEGAKTAIA